jgi:hypothetical protein
MLSSKSTVGVGPSASVPALIMAARGAGSLARLRFSERSASLTIFVRHHWAIWLRKDDAVALPFATCANAGDILARRSWW